MAPLHRRAAPSVRLALLPLLLLLLLAADGRGAAAQAAADDAAEALALEEQLGEAAALLINARLSALEPGILPLEYVGSLGANFTAAPGGLGVAIALGLRDAAAAAAGGDDIAIVEAQLLVPDDDEDILLLSYVLAGSLSSADLQGGAEEAPTEPPVEAAGESPAPTPPAPAASTPTDAAPLQASSEGEQLDAVLQALLTELAGGSGGGDVGDAELDALIAALSASLGGLAEGAPPPDAASLAALQALAAGLGVELALPDLSAFGAATPPTEPAMMPAVAEAPPPQAGEEEAIPLVRSTAVEPLEDEPPPLDEWPAPEFEPPAPEAELFFGYLDEEEEGPLPPLVSAASTKEEMAVEMPAVASTPAFSALAASSAPPFAAAPAAPAAVAPAAAPPAIPAPVAAAAAPVAPTATAPAAAAPAAPTPAVADEDTAAAVRFLLRSLEVRTDVVPGPRPLALARLRKAVAAPPEPSGGVRRALRADVADAAGGVVLVEALIYERSAAEMAAAGGPRRLLESVRTVL